MRLRLHPAALAELDEAVAWYEARRTGWGSLLFEQVSLRIGQAARFPRSGAPVMGFESRYDVRQYVLSRFKYVVILFVVLLSALYALPNIYPQDPSVQVTANRGYAVDAKLKAQVEAELRKAGVAPKAVELSKGGELLVRLASVDAQTKANVGLRCAILVVKRELMTRSATVSNTTRVVGRLRPFVRAQRSIVGRCRRPTRPMRPSELKRPRKSIGMVASA